MASHPVEPEPEMPENPGVGADTPDHAAPAEEPGFEPAGSDPLPGGA
jgi:hypothetical protein